MKRSLRCLFHNDAYAPVDPVGEPECYAADPETVSASSLGGQRQAIGWASVPHGDYERKLLAEHTKCVWVTLKSAPVEIAGDRIRPIPTEMDMFTTMLSRAGVPHEDFKQRTGMRVVVFGPDVPTDSGPLCGNEHASAMFDFDSMGTLIFLSVHGDGD